MIPTPDRSILSSTFKYTPSFATDIRETFEREFARIAAERLPDQQSIIALALDRINAAL